MRQNDIFRGQRDRSRIDLNDPIDVRYIKHQFPWFSEKEIRTVIKEHGPDREAVEAALERTPAHHDDRE